MDINSMALFAYIYAFDLTHDMFLWYNIYNERGCSVYGNKNIVLCAHRQESISESCKTASKDEREYYYYFFYETDFGAFRLLVDKSNRIAYTITAFVNTWNNIFASGVI